MATPGTPTPPATWTQFAIAVVVFALFVVGAAAAYAFLAFGVHHTCERATDSCEFVEVRLFSRDVVNRFQPSKVVAARYFQGGARGGSCVVVEMAGGAPEVRACAKTGEEFAARLNAFVTDPGQARFDYRVPTDPFDYILAGFILFLSLIPLSGAIHLARQKLRPL